MTPKQEELLKPIADSILENPRQKFVKDRLVHCGTCAECKPEKTTTTPHGLTMLYKCHACNCLATVDKKVQNQFWSCPLNKFESVANY